MFRKIFFLRSVVIARQVTLANAGFDVSTIGFYMCPAASSFGGIDGNLGHVSLGEGPLEQGFDATLASSAEPVGGWIKLNNRQITGTGEG